MTGDLAGGRATGFALPRPRAGANRPVPEQAWDSDGGGFHPNPTGRAANGACRQAATGKM